MRVSSGYVRVLPIGELEAGEGLESQIRRVRVGREVVLVGRLQSGLVVAFGSTCPHEATDLDHATFVGGNVRCPRHNYLYDPDSGVNVIPTDVSRRENLWKLRPGYLPTHKVQERDGWVWVSKDPNPPPTSWDPITEQRPSGQPSAAEPVVSPPEPTRPEWRSPVEHRVEKLRVGVGGEFEVRLLAAPVPACSWKIEVPTAIVAIVAQSFQPAASPPYYLVQLRALGLGDGTVRCSYGRPWDPDPIEIRTYAVNIEPNLPASSAG